MSNQSLPSGSGLLQRNPERRADPGPAGLMSSLPVSDVPLPAGWQPALLSRTFSFDLPSHHTGQCYRVLVGLPAEKPSAEGYPVLWMLDGLASYPLTEVARSRSPGGAVAGWRQKDPAGLVVGIGYASGESFTTDARARDYTPESPGSAEDPPSRAHGGAGAFLKFMLEELRPLLACHLPMDPARHSLFGFSYGGLFVLHVLLTEPWHFQRYWAASPSLWFSDGMLLRKLPAGLSVLQRAGPLRVTLTVGLDEQYPEQFISEAHQQHLQARAMVERARAFGQQLEAAALPGLDLDFRVVPGHDHLDMLMHGARRVVEHFAFSP